MASSRVPAALRGRLGDDATFGLIELLESERKSCSEQVMSMAADRFERRLAEEMAGLRQEIGGVRSDLRQEIGSVRVDLLQEIGSVRSDLRQEIGGVRDDLRQEIGDLRQEIGGVRGDLRQDIASVRVEWLKWSFAFWLGQVAVTAGLLAFMLRR